MSHEDFLCGLDEAKLLETLKVSDLKGCLPGSQYIILQEAQRTAEEIHRRITPKS